MRLGEGIAGRLMYSTPDQPMRVWEDGWIICM